MKILGFALIFVMGLGISQFSFAQMTGEGKDRAKVLDFEGEQIEGDRMRPDLFMQVSGEDIKFETLMFVRDNFNDFHEIDKTLKPRYLKQVKGKTK